MASTIWNQNLNAGEEWTASIVLADAAGLPRSLRGTSFTSQIRRHHKSANAKTTIAITIEDAPAGQMGFKLTEAQTTELKDGRYIYDVEMNNAPTLTVSDQSGSYIVDETITGGTSGATGTVLDHTGSVVTYATSTGTFSLSEQITGSNGGVTATVVSANLLGRKERVIEGTIEMRPEVTR